VKTFARFGVLTATLLAGCSTSAATTSSGTTTTGSSGTTTGTTDQIRVGSPCEPIAVVDICAAAGLVCDQIISECRLPENGEPCQLQTGCSKKPTTLGCYAAAVNNIATSVCLIPCTNSDSSDCFYGTSCGDPNSKGFCSALGTPTCVAWGECDLGEGITGQCVPEGQRSTCYAVGTVTERYGVCNPSAINSQTSELCGVGLLCRSSASTLGAPPDAGFCFPLCGGERGDTCRSDEHCFQPYGDAYEICRPGFACELDENTCPSEDSVCVPDDSTGFTGGCLPFTSDAGLADAPCSFWGGVPLSYPCRSGACLPGDGGDQCTPLCNLANGDLRPFCPVNESCAAIDDDSPSAVVGACR
jgi:hypothetical protein